MTHSTNHPDLRDIVCEAISRMLTQPDLPEELRLTSPIHPDRVTIRCQRTWHDIETVSTHINGGSFSACVAQFNDGDDLYSYFVEAVRQRGEDAWRWAGMSGGKQPAAMGDRGGGFMIAGGSHVCVGGVGYAPDGGQLQVEMTDGLVYSDAPVEGCCIVFAPVTTPPSPDDHVVVRIVGSDGTELSADRVWIGNGGPPPGVRPAPPS